MIRIKFVASLIVLLFFCFGCESKTEPNFCYIENNSDENIEISYSNEHINLEAKSNIKLYTVKELQYSLNKTKIIVEFEKSFEEQDINFLAATMNEGFYNGDYCYILKFKNLFSKDLKYTYNIYNTREQPITIQYSLFGITNNIIIDAKKEIQCSFFYKIPELQYYIDEHKISPIYNKEENGKRVITL